MKPCLTCFVGKRDGRVTTIICTNRSLSSFKKIVTPKICNNCSVSGTPSKRPQKAHTEPPTITPLGTLIYARTGWEPPPCPPGYRSKSSDQNSDDAWILVPLNPLCKHLKLRVAETGSCGYHRIARRCTLIESYVGPKTCETCQKNEERNGSRSPT